MSVIDLSKRRQPVHYTVHVTHHWDGNIDVFVEGIEDSPHGNDSVATALRAAADRAEAHGNPHPTKG